MTRADPERGSISVELAILAPVLLVVGLGLVLAAGRVSLANSGVRAAATYAARDASLARDQTDARQRAEATARQSLADQDVRCQRVDVSVDVSGFDVPVGQPAQVTVEVSCQVALSDLALPGTPGSRELTASFTSPLDPYRARQ